MKNIKVLSVTLFVAVCAQSAVVYNGDLNTVVERDPDSSKAGMVQYALDAATETLHYGNGKKKSKTNTPLNAWLLALLSKGFEYSRTGGATGDGAFVQHSKNGFYGKPRAVLQFAKDSKATIGSVDIKMDVFLDDNSSGDDTLRFWVDLYAWNAGATGVALSAGDNLNDIQGADEVRLLDHVILSSASIASATWTTVKLGTIELGAGYDYYAWRIGVVGAGMGDFFAFDNVIVSKPASMGLLSMAMLRR